MKRKRAPAVVTPLARKETVPRAVWIKVYNGVTHLSVREKAGFTKFVAEKFALALFLRAQLRLLEE